MIIYLVDVKKIKPHFSTSLSYLTIERRTKALKYINQEDKLSSVAASLLIRKFVGLDDLKYTENGKPYKDGIHFNLSHSNGICVFVKCDNPVGIDIEKIKDFDDRIMNYAFTLAEIDEVNSDFDFYRIWTLKEAIAKREGTGISNIKEIDTHKDNISFKHIKYNDYIICVSTPNIDDIEIKELEFSDLE